MLSRALLRLRVRRVEQFCIFDLAGNAGQELSATVAYDDRLTELYQHWRQLYQRCYDSRTRARVTSKGGSGTPAAYNWGQELNVAEIALLAAFERWLGQAALLAIREQIQAHLAIAKPAAGKRATPAAGVDLLLECSPIDLARFPWEAWKLAPKDAPPGSFRVARTRFTQAGSPSLPPVHRQGKLRILAIFAAAPDLDHTQDLKALQKLQPLAEIERLDCQLTQLGDDGDRQVTALRQRIAQAINDDRGWDVLFFAGHSDESTLTGGKLEFAPQVSLSISEIEPQLIAAKQRGLQLAIFNSCSGLQIAQSLIGLGLSQVIVMRERIPDAVAHGFLTQFCQNLALHQDVQTALLRACHYLATENLAYPSAYLIPSLFRHPDPQIALFRIEASQLKRLWSYWRLTRWETISLGMVAVLSLMTPVREVLSEQRYWVQALYRQHTQQLPPVTRPPVTIIAIDQESINRDAIDTYQVKPIDRIYLSKIITRLQQLNAKVIGIDYLLDGSTRQDADLATALKSTVQQQKTWFVFATVRNNAGQSIRAIERVASPAWMLQGDTLIWDWDVMQPEHIDCQTVCPFAYQLAMAQALHQQSTPALPQPQLQGQANFQSQVTQYVKELKPQFPIITEWQPQDRGFNLQPIIDFSLPPTLAYNSIAAWDLLQRPLADPTLQALQQQVILIASGGYEQADDNFSLPLATQYWRSVRTPGRFSSSSQPLDQLQVFTGGEAHAYTVHHWLTQHFVRQVPAIWVIGIALGFGKSATLLLRRQPYLHRSRLAWMLLSTTTLSGLVGLQVYVAAQLAIPWFLPSVLVWSYVLPILKR